MVWVPPVPSGSHKKTLLDDNARHYNLSAEKYDDYMPRLFKGWLKILQRCPSDIISDDEWLKAIQYFNGCAICGEMPDNRTSYLVKQLFVTNAAGGNLSKYNVLPCCNNCTWKGNMYKGKIISRTMMMIDPATFGNVFTKFIELDTLVTGSIKTRKETTRVYKKGAKYNRPAARKIFEYFMRRMNDYLSVTVSEKERIALVAIPVDAAVRLTITTEEFRKEMEVPVVVKNVDK